MQRDDQSKPVVTIQHILLSKDVETWSHVGIAWLSRNRKIQNSAQRCSCRQADKWADGRKDGRADGRMDRGAEGRTEGYMGRGVMANSFAKYTAKRNS